MLNIKSNFKLPDPDFVIAKQHKLVPSVIGDIQVKAKTFSSDAVTYSGPTYIGIWSTEHLGLSAYNYLTNTKKIRELPELERSFKNSKNEEKLVTIIVTVDEGPNENPRYEKTASCGLD